MLFLIAITTNTPLDDYDIDVTTEENDDCRQPKEKKLYNAKGNFVPSKHPFYTFVSVGVTNKIDDKAVTELKESSTNDTCNSELSKYEEYLKEAMKNHSKNMLLPRVIADFRVKTSRRL